MARKSKTSAIILEVEYTGANATLRKRFVEWLIDSNEMPKGFLSVKVTKVFLFQQAKKKKENETTKLPKNEQPRGTKGRVRRKKPQTR